MPHTTLRSAAECMRSLSEKYQSDTHADSDGGALWMGCRVRGAFQGGVAGGSSVSSNALRARDTRTASSRGNTPWERIAGSVENVMLQ